jgi:hypothetical protein
VRRERLARLLKLPRVQVLEPFARELGRLLVALDERSLDRGLIAEGHAGRE